MVDETQQEDNKDSLFRQDAYSSIFQHGVIHCSSWSYFAGFWYFGLLVAGRGKKQSRDNHALFFCFFLGHSSGGGGEIRVPNTVFLRQMTVLASGLAKVIRASSLAVKAGS